MASVKLNDAELDVFQRLIWDGYPFAVLIYTMELRRFMDYSTGVVGAKRRVSEAGMLEMLERHAKQGSHNVAKRRTRDFVQRQLAVLCDVGLLVRLPKKKRTDPMLFKLPLADVGLVRSQEERTMSAQGGAHKGFSVGSNRESPEFTGAAVVRAAHVDNSKSAQNDNGYERTTSGYPVITTTTTTARGSAMTEGWLPSAEVVRDLKMLGLSGVQVIDLQTEFKRYWIEQGGVAVSWGARLLSHAKRQIDRGFVCPDGDFNHAKAGGVK